MLLSLLFRFWKPLLIATIVSAFMFLMHNALENYANQRAAIAVGRERFRQVGLESAHIESIIRDYNVIIDSLNNHVQEDSIRATVQKHKEKLVKVQAVDQSKVDSLVNATRDSAVKIVVDSVASEFKVLISRFRATIQDDSIIEASLNREIMRKNSVIELKNTQMAALEDFNKRLHADLDNAVPRLENNKESFGHFIVHKALPVAVVTFGTGYTIYKIATK